MHSPTYCFRRGRLCAALLIALASPFAAEPASAQSYFWDGTAGSWADQSRWQLTGGAPAPSLPNSGTDTFIRRDNSLVTVGITTAATRDLVVGGLAERSASMIISGGSALATSGSAFVGRVGVGDVAMGNANWAIAGDLWVGGFSDDVGGAARVGQLLLRVGQITANRAYIGASNNATGSLVLDSFNGSAGGTINVSQELVVGARRDAAPAPAGGGTGSAFLTAGAQLISASGILGEHEGSQGTVTLTAANTSWSVNNRLDIGKEGVGYLEVLAGARAQAGSTVIASNGIGLVDVLGNGRLQSAQSLTVGEFGDAILNLAGGGSVGVGGALNNGTIELATGPGSTGRIRVGMGGTTTPGILDVALLLGGVGGTLELNHSEPSYDLANSFGEPVSVGGALRLEHLGPGTTRLFADSIYGGPTVIRNGTLDVDGVRVAGPSSDLRIGSLGSDSGHLMLRNGARALSGFGDLLIASGGASSSGSVDMSGSNTRLEARDAFVGLNGSGTVQLTSGAIAQTRSTVLGEHGAGSLSLGGTGTRWEVTGSELTVGRAGHGTVNLRGGALLGVAGGARTLVLASQPFSTGTLNIGTGGPTGTLDVHAVEGGGGLARLTFHHTNAGYLFASADGVPIGILGSTRITHLGPGRSRIRSENPDNPFGGDVNLLGGALQLEDGARLLHGNGDLLAGEMGSPQLVELDVIEGAQLKTRLGRLGMAAASNVSARVNGAGSGWTLTDELFVGGSGGATLSLLAGATVIASRITLGLAPSSTGTGSIAGLGTHLRSAAAVVIGSEGSGSLTVRGGARLSAGGAAGSGTVVLAEQAGSNGMLAIGNGAQPGVINAAAVLGGAGSASLHFNHEAADYRFENSQGFPVSILGEVDLVHEGPGTTRLDGTLGYSGDTSVWEGTLIVNGPMASAGVDVGPGGGFGGSAVITGGGLGVQAGGRLMPGDGVGTLQTTALFLHPSAEVTFELSTPGVAGSGLNDLVVVTDDLVLGGQLHIVGLPGFGQGRYPLISYAGELVDAGAGIASLPPGFGPGDAALDFSVPGEVALAVTGGALADSIFRSGFEASIAPRPVEAASTPIASGGRRP